jgi:hypothetical protein
LLPAAQPPAPASRGRLYVSDALRARLGRRLPLGKF